MSNKKQLFLEILDNLQADIDFYSKQPRLLRSFLMKEKGLLKILSIFLNKFLKIKIKKKIKTFWNREMFVFLNDGDATFLYFFGILFGDEINITKFLIKNLKDNDIFYDIGANYGFYTLLAQEFITTGEIHSFEPNPDIFNLLKENSKLNIFKNTFLNKLALSDKNGEAEFYNLDIKGHSGASSLIKYNHFKKYEIIKVKTMKFDDYIYDYKPPNLIKIDTEGSENLVLKGGLNLIKKFKPIIIMEFWPDDNHLEAAKILFDNNYNVYKIDENGDLFKVDKNILLTKNPNCERNYVFKI
jgi:FkbM family methyltransferase